MSTDDPRIAAILSFMKELNTVNCADLRVTATSNLGDDLGLNSLSILLLVVWIKERFNANVFEQVGNVSALQTVEDVLALMDAPT